jgi:ADP-heptose:LPS heptosyltransferase
MRILAYGCGDLIGDGLRKLHFWSALRAQFPGAHITYLSDGDTVYRGVLAAAVQGLIDEIAQGGPRALRRRRFDFILDTQTSWWRSLLLKHTPHGMFVSYACNGALSERAPPPRPVSLHARLIALLSAACGKEIRYTPVTLSLPYDEAARTLLPPGPRYFAIAPGAGGQEKRWPLERFAEIARVQGDVPVFLLGPDELAEWHALRDAVPGALFPLQDARCPAMHPLMTVSLAAQCCAGLANDSGASHMLALAGIPLVLLYGPTDPAKHAPPVAKLRVLRGRTMEEIAVGSVMEAISSP